MVETKMILGALLKLFIIIHESSLTVVIFYQREIRLQVFNVLFQANFQVQLFASRLVYFVKIIGEESQKKEKKEKIAMKQQ